MSKECEMYALVQSPDEEYVSRKEKKRRQEEYENTLYQEIRQGGFPPTPKNIANYQVIRGILTSINRLADIRIQQEYTDGPYLEDDEIEWNELKDMNAENGMPEAGPYGEYEDRFMKAEKIRKSLDDIKGPFEYLFSPTAYKNVFKVFNFIVKWHKQNINVGFNYPHNIPTYKLLPKLIRKYLG